MTCTTFRLADTHGTDLSSRHRAAELRAQIVDLIESGSTPITIDFAGVRTLSDSFADELIAVLVRDLGEVWFRQHVRLTNLSSELRLSILEAVAERCHKEPA